MAETIRLFDDFLKYLYLPGVHQVTNNSAFMYSQMTRDRENFVGKKAVLALETGLLPTYSRAEGGVIGPAGEIPKEQALIDLAYHYVNIEFTNPLRAISAEAAGAFIPVMTASVRSAMSSIRRMLAMEIATSEDGLIATISSVNAGAGTTANPYIFTVDTNQWAWNGMKIDIYAAGTSTSKLQVLTTPLTITTRKDDDKIYATGACGAGGASAGAIANTDQIYIYGNKSNQMLGFGDVFYAPTDAATGLANKYLDVDKWLLQEWQAQTDVPSGAARAFSMNSLQTSLDNAEVNADGRTNLILCRAAMRRSYLAKCVADRRFNYPATLKLDGGFTALAYTGGTNEIPIVADRDIKQKTFYGIDMSTWTLHQAKQFSWIPGPDGRILHPLIYGDEPKDKVRAILACYENLSCKHPAKNWIYGNVIES